MPAKKPLPEIGAKFGKWEYLEDLKWGKWMCKCSCGVEKAVERQHLVEGRSTSCGHDRAEKTSQKMTKHGHSFDTSGLYSVWKNMKQRCSNPKNDHFNTYGARGIKVCPRWLDSFENFKADVGEPPVGFTLGRVDNDGNYEPGNVEWQTPKVQSRNKTSTYYMTLKGETKPMADWSDLLGISYAVLSARVHKLKWSDEKALTTPVRNFTKTWES